MADHERRFSEVLALEPSGEDRFTTTLDGFEGVSFGGQTLGCGALAAARTCGDRTLHALHACFLKRVPAEVPIEIRVERTGDGRRLSRRRVQVRHETKVLCEFVVSFAVEDDGPEYQDAKVDLNPPPERLEDEEQVAKREGWEFWSPGAVEWRWIGAPWNANAEEPSFYRAWVRPRFPIGEDPGMHSAALAFLSDFHSHWPVGRKLGGDFEPWGFTSLDTTLWIHRSQPWEDWCLLTSETDVGHAGRALTRRSLFTQNGKLLASMAQEAFIPSQDR